MDNETHPATGVPQPSVEDRMTAFLSEEPAAPVADEAETAAEAEAPQPEPEQASEELTAEDIPDGEPEPSVPDAFEIVHNGQQHSLSREDVIRYAQQGFDYTQKTQAVAAREKEVAARLERLAQIEQASQHVSAELATVKAFEAQLRQYESVDWVKVATDEPLEYPKYRAQYDQLLNGYNKAVQQYQQKRSAVDNAAKELRDRQTQEERQQLLTRIPEWKDPQKYQAGATALRTWLIGQGATEQEVDGLTSSLAVSIAYKAMKYDNLEKAKADKVKQLRTQPPVTRPGAAPAKGQVQADKQREMAQRLKKSGDLKDAAALLLTRMR